MVTILHLHPGSFDSFFNCFLMLCHIVIICIQNNEKTPLHSCSSNHHLAWVLPIFLYYSGYWNDTYNPSFRESWLPIVVATASPFPGIYALNKKHILPLLPSPVLLTWSPAEITKLISGFCSSAVLRVRFHENPSFSAALLAAPDSLVSSAPFCVLTLKHPILRVTYIEGFSLNLYPVFCTQIPPVCSPFFLQLYNNRSCVLALRPVSTLLQDYIYMPLSPVRPLVYITGSSFQRFQDCLCLFRTELQVLHRFVTFFTPHARVQLCIISTQVLRIPL